MKAGDRVRLKQGTLADEFLSDLESDAILDIQDGDITRAEYAKNLDPLEQRKPLTVKRQSDEELWLVSDGDFELRYHIPEHLLEPCPKNI